MSVAKLKKVVLYYHRSIQEDILQTLQKSGVCEIIPNAEATEESPALDAVHTKVAECESVIADLRFLLRFLEPSYQDPVPSLDRALGEKPVSSIHALASLAAATDVSALAEQVRELEHKLSSIRLEMTQINSETEILRNIADFPYPLDIFNSKGRLRAILGSMPLLQSEDWKSALLQEVGLDCEVYLSVPAAKSRDIWGAVLYAAECDEKVMEVCAHNNFTVADVMFTGSGMASKELETLTARMEQLKENDASVRAEISAFANEHVADLREVSDYWNILKSRYEALASGQFTESAVVTSFWVPEKSLDELQSSLTAIGAVSELVAADPTPEDDAPTMMVNSSLCLPFESLTKLYSPPKYGDIDPTPLLAPFFFIFFGMCLGDAGYAMVMGGLILMLFKKYKRIPAGMKEFIKLFAFVSISTLVYGLITGSIFGDLFNIVPFLKPLESVRQALTFIDPMKDPILVLGISLAFGVVHLFFGLLISMFNRLRRGEYVDAIGDNAAWLTFLVGLMLIGACAAGVVPASAMGVAQGVTLLGALVIMWYAGREKKGIFSKLISGLMALYGSTSWLGDILSYSRLLALGLASAAVGMIINMLGGLAADIPYVGWLIAVIVVVGGHIFSILVNVLGSFVHSLRLQYVEFFSKFYSGGGRLYSPLSYDAQYVEISDQ